MTPEAEHPAPPAKQELRRLLRAQRRALVPHRNQHTDGDAIATAVSALLDTLSLPASLPTSLPTSLSTSLPTSLATSLASEHTAYDGLPCVAIYRSLPTEPPTQALAEMLHARKVAVIVPETLPDMSLDWRELLPDGNEGPRLGLDGIGAAQLILTPALAVDHRGTRMGQGGGCYDRALARRRSDALIVAIVNDEEYAARSLPRDAHDVPMDAVITPGGGFSKLPHPRSVA